MIKISAFALAIATGSLSLFAGESPLPNPTAPFRTEKGGKLDPVLKVGTFVSEGKTYDQPSFWIGNKRIGIRETNGRFVTD